MKNIFRFLMAALLIVGAVSCTKENVSSLAGGEVEVTFTADLPAMGTRAYADGTNATLLRYWVYDASNGELLPALSSQVKGSGTFTFTLPLIKGMTYDFVLWADKEGLYTVENDIVTVDYANANDNDRDAFYGYVQGFDPVKDTPKFTLTRPFAQLNAATSDKMEDIVANGLTLEASSLKTKVYTQFDIKARDVVAGSLAEVELQAAAMPYMSKNELPGKETYTYLAMNYLLAPQSGMVADVTFFFNGKKSGADFTVGGAEGLSYNSVPLKQNYRTNLLGQLLTKSTEIEVEILPGFGVPDIEDYEEVAEGLCLINGDTYLITSLEGLKNFAAMADGVTRAKTSFAGKTVELATDIDLENDPWTPIGEFNGTFDGKDHTIKNVKIVAEGTASAGFFAAVQGTVKNLTLENVDIQGHFKTGAIVANGMCSRIENCHVINGTIVTSPYNKDDGNNCGGITGYLSAEPSAWVKDCSVKNVDVIAYRDCGGLIGTVTGSTVKQLEVSGNTVENVNVVANQLDEYGEEKDANAGEIVGRNLKNVDLADNTATDVVVDVLKWNNDTLEFKSVAAFEIFANLVNAGNSCAGKTIKLADDVDLDGVDFPAIGYNPSNNSVSIFEGTFDGDNHTIKNISQQNLSGAYKQTVGLFAKVNNATFKNVVMDDFSMSVYGAEAGVIATWATGDCHFENIVINNGDVVSYNCETGGVLGWAESGNFTFKDITVGSDVKVTSLWDSYDTPVGGIIGGVGSSSGYSMSVKIENANVACKLDVYNDVCSNYQWGAYRRAGMLVGNIRKTQNINGTDYPDPANEGIICSNVTVTYGDWMNYHYCEFKSNGHGSYDDEYTWKCTRVEASDWGSDGIDTSHCQHESFESHNMCLPIDQLFGGDQGVYGLAEYPGVTVNYPASYVRGVASVADINNAKALGIKQIVLENDLDCGSTQLALDGISVDLGGNTLTTNMTYGGMALKNGASIKNGTIEHTTTVAAIKAFNAGSIENVTIKCTCTTADKVITGIAVQQGGHVGTIKNVTVEGASQSIEVPYQATVDLIENVTTYGKTNGTAVGQGLLINGGKVVKAVKSTFKGEDYGVQMHLKSVFAVGLELENCTVEGTDASVYAWDEKDKSNTSGSLTLTYDAATKLNGPFVWDFEDECKSVVTLNKPE